MGRAPVSLVPGPATRARFAPTVVEGQDGRARWAGVSRLAVPAALAYSSTLALVQLGLVLTYPGRTEHAPWAILATACYLPIFLWQVHAAVTETRPAPVWTFAVVAVIVAAAVPLAGSNWLPVFAVVAVSAMLVLPWPRSLLVALTLAVAQAPLAVLLDSPVPAAAAYYVFTLWWRASALFVPIWLLRALRQLSVAQHALAEKAVVDERLRIDRDVRTAVGSALETIATHADAAAERVESDPAQAARHLRTSVEVSRRASADARRLLRSYRSRSLAAEAAAAAALLTAAGIQTSVELADADRDLRVDPQLRSRLRQAIAATLHDGGARTCVIRIGRGTDTAAPVSVRIEAQP
jgi:two-component system, NarL family, sensor histidine kinase DesK